MSRASDNFLKYVWSTDPDEVRAAGEAVKAEQAAGKPIFERTLSTLEQRKAGMPPPSQRPEFAVEAPAATVAGPDASELEQARAQAARAEEKYNAAFEEQARAQAALDALEVETAADEWNTDDIEPVVPVADDEIAERQSTYDIAHDETAQLSPYAQDALRAMGNQ